MADSNMTIGLSANIDVSNVLTGVKQIQNALGGLKIDPKLTANLTKEFSNLQNYLKDYQKMLGKENMSKGDLKTLQKLEDSINSSFSKVIDLQNEISSKPILLKADSTQLDSLIEKTKEAKKALDDAFSKVNIGNSTGGIAQIESAIEKAVSRSKTLKQSFEDAFSDLSKGNLEQFSNKIDNIFQGLSGKVLKGKLIPTVDNLIDSFQKLGLIDINIKTETAGEKLVALKAGIQALKDGIAKGLSGEELKGLISNLEAATKAEKEFETEASKRGQDRLSPQITKTQQLAAATRDGAKAEREFQQATMSAVDQVKQLQQSTQYFFSLRNMINLLKRGVREAFNTVKELDKAMTETAVVTNFDVGDMWEKLPQYTANANALGASVKDMYESTTLYYQQGLETQAAMGIAAETMKMARIGGLEAVDATDKMTAALRGFNMELNEASARRVNDVYSNLAAKTASDTEELGTAMQRTASIAASAGMSFEGTAAFLAQAIETTREPAENIGTAMKTIVARFQEMKENPLEIAEVDGEEVSYNKVDKALQSIGVSLKDTNGQFRELDQVFLDISQRWGSLSQTQQRYIATIAAGSRQQSRFIAMMNNYDRTVELMDYANNSAGASNEQFGKTMESLEAKLNKLKNAYQQFTMGIANNTFIKGAVDGLTFLFNTTNNLIDTLSAGSSVVKSFLSLFTAFKVLKTGGRIANSLIGGLGGMIDPTSTFRAGFKGGAIGRNSAQAVSQPIVKELQNIRQLIAQRLNSGSGKGITNSPYDQYERFKSARENFLKISKNGGTVDEVQKLFKGLSFKNQNLLMKSFSGTIAATNRAILGGYQNKGGQEVDAKTLRKGQAFLNNERKSARLTAEEYFKALQDPGVLRDALKGAGVSKENATYKYLDELNKEVDKQLEENRKGAISKLQNTKKYEGLTEEEQQALEQRVNDNYKGDRQRRKAIKQVMGEEGNPKVKLEPWEKAVDAVGRVGSAMTQAGMGVQAFGSLLSNSANPAISMFGSALSSIGGTISALGMTVSSAGSAFSSVASVIGGGWTAAIGIALVAITGLVAGIKAHNEAIRKEAKELSETYKDKSQKNQTNIVNLTQWKEEFPRLAQGVDENGLNVSLDPSDYQHYLEIVDAIAEMNPEIVNGYNAQGHAIIDNNSALEKTLALEQERGEEITKNYTNTEAWNKLIKARNLEARTYNTGKELKPKHMMAKQAAIIGSRLLSAQQEGLIDLSGFNIDLGLLSQGYESEVNKFLQQYDKIKQRINTAIENAGDEWSEYSSEAIMKAFSKYEEASGKLDELVQPLYESMSTYASGTKAYAEMDDRFKPYFQDMLKNLAEDADIDTEAEMRKKVEDILEQVESVSPVVTEALEEIESARADFVSNLNEEEYDLAIEKPLEQLQELRDAFSKQGNDELVQWIDNLMTRAQQRVVDGTQTIKGAINTLTDEIAAAESATDDFKEKTKKDFSTAAEGMKSIFDTAMEKDDNGNYTHRGYKGDNTYWTAASELLGDISGKSKEAVDKMMDNLEPMLRDGPEGFAKFALKVRSLKDEIKEIEGVDWDDTENFISKIDDSANPEVWAQLAKKMGMSEQVLISLLNKGRQFADIDFSDGKALKTALLNDPNTVTGANGTIIMTSEQLRDAMGSAEYYRTGKDKKRDYKEEGIYVAQEVEKFTRKNATNLAKNLGIDLTEGSSGSITRELIDKIGGLYNKDDLQKIAQKTYEAQLGLKTGEQLTDKQKEDFIKDYNAAYKEWGEAQENELLAPVQSIEGCVKTLANDKRQEKVKEGQLTADMLQGKAIEKAVFGKDKKEDDSLADYFKKGKDAQGEKLTETTYKQSLNELTSLKNELKTYKQQLQEGRQNAIDNGLDTTLYDQELDTVDNALVELGDALADGKHYFEDILNGDGKGPKSVDKPGTDKDNLTDTGTGTKGTKEPSEEKGTVPPSPYTPEQEALYSKNSWGDLFKAAGQGIIDFLKKGQEITQTESEARQQQNQEATGKTAEELKAENTKFWNDVINWFKPQEQSGEETSPTLQSAETLVTELSTGAQSLTNTASTLDTAGTALNTAAQNLTNAAAILAANKSGPSAPTQSTPGMPSNVPPNQQSSASGIVVVDNSPAKASLEEINALATETKENIEKGATFNVDVTGAGKLNQASKDANSLINKNGKGASIAVSTGAVDKDSVKKSITQINKSKATILVDANTKAAEQKARTLANKIDSYHATIDIYPNFTGNWSKTVSIKKQATGAHNHGYAPSPSFGSAARGSYGQVGPKGKGGLTLTGELGYEIAWIPSENRSMILGANGPQMVNLPGDAVVWTHEQSKKIMKQRSIPAGSHAVEGKASISGIDAFLSAYSASVGSGTVSAVKKTGKAVQKAAEDTAKKIGYVSVWWENIARQTENTQRKMDNNAKMFDKYLKEMRSTLKTTGESLASGGGGGDAYIKTISDYVGLNQAQLDRANQELRTLDNGTKAQQKAAKTKSKKDDKKANNSAFNSGAASAIQISYEKGKGKKKKTANEIISTTKYTKYDKNTDTYLVDQEQLNKIKNKSKRKAVKEAVTKEIDDRTSKKNKAQDNIQKANEALEKMGEELYNTFFKWEIELTKIWNITQKIERLEADMSRSKSYQDLLQSQLANGTRTANTSQNNEIFKAFELGIEQQKENIEKQTNLLSLQRKNLADLLTFDDEKTILEDIQTKLIENIRKPGTLNDTQVLTYETQAEKLEELINAQTKAWEFMDVKQFSDGTISLDFDADKFRKEQLAGNINETEGKAIQDYVKQLVEADKTLRAQYETITSKMTELNNSLGTLQEEWVGYANELWDISEAEQRKEVDNLKKLNDSITSTMKNLLDDVKKKLEQRRKQEDNAKTERDISQKQQRLAALRADTSGGNKVEIAQLEKEIADAQQNYQRSLEDQMLDNLQQQADLASEQRERQIALQEGTITAINNAVEVNKWMANPTAYRDVILEAYKTANDFDKKPQALQEDILRKFEVMFSGLVNNQNEQKLVNQTLESLEQQRDQVEEDLGQIAPVVSILDEIKASIEALEIPTSIKIETDGGVEEGGTSKMIEDEQAKVDKENENASKVSAPIDSKVATAYNSFLQKRGSKKNSGDKNWGKLGKDGLEAQIKRGGKIGKSEAQVLQDLANTSALTWTEVVKAYEALKGKKKAAKNLISFWGKNPSDSKKKAWKNVFGKKYDKYATGGLADYTGPAWLDGTPSRPELVLNAADTKNFIALRDILSKVVRVADSSEGQYGNATYEININVDKIASDYDVDKMAERVKKIIVKDSSYRNVTQVRKFR